MNCGYYYITNMVYFFLFELDFTFHLFNYTKHNIKIRTKSIYNPSKKKKPKTNPFYIVFLPNIGEIKFN